MSYLGQPPRFGDYPVKTFTGNGSLTSFSLDHSVPSDASIIVFIDGVRQHVGSYSAAGTAVLDFGAGNAPANSTSIEVVHLGLEATLNTPAALSVATGMIVDDAVTADKLANSINTEIAANTAKVTNATHTGDVTGATALTIATDAVDIAMLSATGTASSSTFLRGDNSWAEVSGGTAWQAVQTSAFTAVAGKGYPCNTTSAAFTITLPATASVGDTIEFVDYAGTFDTNSITLDPQSLKLKGQAGDLKLLKEREGVRLVYADATQGWVAASAVNESAPALSPLEYDIEYLVVAGGGGGGGLHRAGGGGAGGYRNSFASETSGRNSSTETAWTISAGTVVTVTVGGGGAMISTANGGTGSTSSLIASGQTTVSSYGGGGGGKYQTNATAGTYGSGAGGGHEDNVAHTGSDGTAAQGFDGGDTGSTSTYNQGGGGGGASENGDPGGTTSANAGGNGLASSITGAAVTRAGGGGAGSYGNGGYSTGGTGGGGNGGSDQASDPNSGVADGSGYYYPVSGTVNTGGGGGGVAGPNGNSSYGAGGSGVIVLRMASGHYTGTVTGSPTVSTDGAYKVLLFNASGSYTT